MPFPRRITGRVPHFNYHVMAEQTVNIREQRLRPLPQSPFSQVTFLKPADFSGGKVVTITQPGTYCLTGDVLFKSTAMGECELYEGAKVSPNLGAPYDVALFPMNGVYTIPFITPLGGGAYFGLALEYCVGGVNAALVIDSDDVCLDLGCYSFAQEFNFEGEPDMDSPAEVAAYKKDLYWSGVRVLRGHRNVRIVGQNAAIRNWAQVGIRVDGGCSNIHIGDSYGDLLVTECGTKNAFEISDTVNSSLLSPAVTAALAGLGEAPFTKGFYSPIDLGVDAYGGMLLGDSYFIRDVGRNEPYDTPDPDNTPLTEPVEDVHIINASFDRNANHGIMLGEHHGVTMKRVSCSRTFTPKQAIFARALYQDGTRAQGLAYLTDNDVFPALRSSGLSAEDCKFSDTQGSLLFRSLSYGTLIIGAESTSFKCCQANNCVGSVTVNGFRHATVLGNIFENCQANGLVSTGEVGGLPIIRPCQAEGFHVSGFSGGDSIGTPNSNPGHSVVFRNCQASLNRAGVDGVTALAAVAIGFAPVGSDGMLIDSCQSTHNEARSSFVSSHAAGVSIAANAEDSALNISVRNCHFSKHSGTSAAVGHGVVAISPTTGQPIVIENLTVEDCHITGNTGDGILVGAVGVALGECINVHNNRLLTNGGAGIHLAAVSQSIIQKNTLLKNGGDAVLLDTCTDFTVTDNTIAYNGTDAVTTVAPAGTNKTTPNTIPP